MAHYSWSTASHRGSFYFIWTILLCILLSLLMTACQVAVAVGGKCNQSSDGNCNEISGNTPIIQSSTTTGDNTSISTSPQSDSFSINRGGSLTTSNGTTICMGDIVGPNFGPDSDLDTGEIVVSQHASIQLQFPFGGSCTHWTT